MRAAKIYIAGRVTGIPREEAVKNFKEGARIALLNGWDPCNPIDHVPIEVTPTEAMQICIPLLLKCDAILMLENWMFSHGAQIELKMAQYCGKKVYAMTDLT